MNITQEKIRDIIRQREAIVAAQNALDKQESALLFLLKHGATLEKGSLTARIKQWSRRNVSWKQVCERQCGSAYVHRVLAATKPDIHERLELLDGIAKISSIWSSLYERRYDEAAA